MTATPSNGPGPSSDPAAVASGAERRGVARPIGNSGGLSMPMTVPKGPRWLLALVLFSLSFGLVFVAQREQGIARDEVVYMHHGDRYASFWIDLVTAKGGVLNEANITAHFGGPGATDGNREHPPLMKTLFGLSNALFHRQLGWTSQVSAYRLPTAAMNALLIALVFLFVAARWGDSAAVVAALLTLFLPRAFFHAGLAAFDAPIVTFWFATLMAYLRALESRQRVVGPALVLSIAYGFALATKHNAILIPAALFPHYVYVALRSQWQSIRGRGIGGLGRGLKVLATYRPSVIAAVVIGGPLVLVAVWPWLWFDTLAHVRDWMAFHFNHVHYNFEYLGDNWNAPPFPWHVPVVTTLVTVPTATLVAAGCGAVALLARARRGAAAAAEQAPALLLFLSAGVSMGPFLLRTTPVFGAEKHWAPAIVTICIYAGVGVAVVAARTARALRGYRFARRVAAAKMSMLALVLVGGAVVCAAAAETGSARPYGLSYYTALAGGPAGGADLGMNRQFWGYSARGVLPWIESRVDPVKGAPVYTHDASPAWGLYEGLGLRGKNLRDAGREQAGINTSQFAIIIHERHFARHDYMVWKSYGTVQPRYVLRFGGVPIVSVYERPTKN